MGNDRQEPDNIVNPLAQLQQLIVPAEMFEFEKEIKLLQQNLARIEQKIYNRKEWLSNMESLMAEMVKSQVAIEGSEIKKAIASIVAEEISSRKQGDEKGDRPHDSGCNQKKCEGVPRRNSKSYRPRNSRGHRGQYEAK